MVMNNYKEKNILLWNIAVGLDLDLFVLYTCLSQITQNMKFIPVVKGELQRENKLISYDRAFKMLDNDMYITGIGQVVLELLSFKVGSGNHQRGISLF